MPIVKVDTNNIKLDSMLKHIRKEDGWIISKYADNMKNGVKFPPILVNSKTDMIVDGLLRYKAFRRAYGTSTKIEVEYKLFKDDESVIVAFINANKIHGYLLSQKSKAMAMKYLVDLYGYDNKKLSKLFGVSITGIKSVLGRTILAIDGTANVRTKIKDKLPYYMGKGAEVALVKNNTVPYGDIVKYDDMNSAMDPLELMDQLIEYITSGFFKSTDKEILVKIKELVKVLDDRNLI